MGVLVSLLVASDEVGHRVSCVAVVDHPHLAEVPLGVTEFRGFDGLQDHKLFVDAFLLEFHHGLFHFHVTVVLHVFNLNLLLDSDLLGLAVNLVILFDIVILLHLRLNLQNVHLVLQILNLCVVIGLGLLGEDGVGVVKLSS